MISAISWSWKCWQGSGGACSYMDKEIQESRQATKQISLCQDSFRCPPVHSGILWAEHGKKIKKWRPPVVGRQGATSGRSSMLQKGSYIKFIHLSQWERWYRGLHVMRDKVISLTSHSGPVCLTALASIIWLKRKKKNETALILEPVIK